MMTEVLKPRLLSASLLFGTKINNIGRTGTKISALLSEAR